MPTREAEGLTPLTSDAWGRFVAQLRSAPYRFFFPLGALLSLAGVLPWALFAFAHGAWRPELHAVTEVQGALMAFAVGFLFTFVPRRTGTPHPTLLECGVAFALLLPPPVLVLFELPRAAQVSWAVLALALAAFVLLRMLRAMEKGVAVAQLLWLPASFGMAVVGAGLMAAAAAASPMWMTTLGRALVWQGMLAGLVTGIGGMLLPMLLHREPHRGDRSARAWCVNAVGCAAFIASFVVEAAVGIRAGYALRGIVVLAILVVSARLWRLPKERGLHRWTAWFSAWMIPVGFLAVALFPVHRAGLLHITLLSGFGLLTLSVANHVSVAHGGRDPLLFARPVPLMVMFAAIVLATLARVLVTVDAVHMMRWIGTAFGFFTVALVAWAVWVFPRIPPARVETPR